MSVDAAVEAADLVVRIAGADVLGGVSLTVAAGEAVAVSGPSGSGKSTLLHALSGLIAPTSGRVVLDGVDLGGLGERRRSRLRLSRCGFVPQFGDLVPELTLGENVALPLRLLGRPRREAETRSGALMSRLGIAEVADHRAGEASGGQVQRAAVARALVHDPAVVLADEPTGSLDTVTGERVLDELLGQVRERGAALVLVTHEAKVAAHADRDVVLRDGLLRDPAALVGDARPGLVDGGAGAGRW